MIKPFVKKFIEDHIAEIEQANWRQVTSRWYDSALFHSLDYDETMFDQFVAIMNHVVGIDFLKQAEKARYDEIYFELTEIIHDHINNTLMPGRGQYKKNIYTDQLVTLLGFTEEEAIQICDAVVGTFGYNYDEDYYYIGEEQ